MQMRVKDLMKKDPVIISPDSTLREAAQQMDAVNCGALPVGTSEHIEGVITDRDIVIRAVARGKDAENEVVRDYMSPGILSVDENAPAEEAAELMRHYNVNRVVVENEDGKPRGIISFGRILREDTSMQEITEVIERTMGEKVG